MNSCKWEKESGVDRCEGEREGWTDVGGVEGWTDVRRRERGWTDVRGGEVDRCEREREGWSDVRGRERERELS